MSETGSNLIIRKKFMVSFIIGIASGIATVFFSLAMGGLLHDHLVQFFMGFLIAFVTSYIQFFTLPAYIRHYSFPVFILINALLYFIFLNIVIALFMLTFGFAGVRSTFPELWLDKTTHAGVVFGVVLDIIFILINTVSTIMGQNVLPNLLTGRYHKPREESVVVMFLDIMSFTAISEKIGAVKSLSLVNDFFTDMTGAVVLSRGEIYKYVGDEVIMVWKKEQGLRDAEFIRFFFRLQDIISERGEIYRERYGLVPRFKAGCHIGNAVVGEVGYFKKEIAYMGDVLNTASRIESQCNVFEREFLISKELFHAVKIPESFRTEEHGAVAIRGKEEAMHLVSVHRR